MGEKEIFRERNLERAEDKFASALDRIELIGGGLYRASFVVKITRGSRRLIVPCDFGLVMPVTSLPDALGKTIAATSRTIFARDDGSITLVQ